MKKQNCKHELCNQNGISCYKLQGWENVKKNRFKKSTQY